MHKETPDAETRYLLLVEDAAEMSEAYYETVRRLHRRPAGEPFVWSHAYQTEIESAQSAKTKAEKRLADHTPEMRRIGLMR